MKTVGIVGVSGIVCMVLSVKDGFSSADFALWVWIVVAVIAAYRAEVDR